MNGTLIGKIYPATEGTIGITWDGNYLWTSGKTCEVWIDEKIFQIEILDDQIILLNLIFIFNIEKSSFQELNILS